MNLLYITWFSFNFISCAGGETIDECGLRYLLAMRLHTCLLTSLPPLYRLQLLHQGMHFIHYLHSIVKQYPNFSMVCSTSVI